MLIILYIYIFVNIHLSIYCRYLVILRIQIPPIMDNIKNNFIKLLAIYVKNNFFTICFSKAVIFSKKTFLSLQLKSLNRLHFLTFLKISFANILLHFSYLFKLKNDALEVIVFGLYSFLFNLKNEKA